jgi:hypothetical protein
MSQPITLIAFKVGELLVDEIRDQILEQGHYMTGSLSKSVSHEQEITPDGVIIRFLLNDYGVPVNTGVVSSRIPYGTYTGAKVSKYIQGLIRFAKIRFRVTEKQAKGIAFAIANKHKKEGMPTRGSYRYSKNGKRTRYIEDAIEKSTQQILKLIGDLETEITKTFNEA